jgi:multiple sugar transport system permease protein
MARATLDATTRGPRPAPPSGRGRGAPTSLRRRDAWTGLGFVAPGVVALLVVLGLPIVIAIANSFVDPEGGGFTLSNYLRLPGDAAFRNSLRISLTFVAATVALHLVLGLAVALALHSAIRGRNLWRVLMLLPWTVPDVVSGLVWRFMLNPTSGIVNDVLRQAGLMEGYVDWLGDARLALPSVIFSDVWRGYPFVMIILLAGLQSIDQDLYAAARVDGADALPVLRRITLPLLKPILLVAAALDTIWQFRRFGLIYNMTQGGPGRATEILSLNIYKQYFRFFQYEIASAMAVVLACVVLLASLLYLRATLRAER